MMKSATEYEKLANVELDKSQTGPIEDAGFYVGRAQVFATLSLAARIGEGGKR